MLDTSDYDTDWSNFYQNWYEKENIYLRDLLYRHSCDHVDFQGSFVTPSFLLAYLSGEKSVVSKLSSQSSFKWFQVDLFCLTDF